MKAERSGQLQLWERAEVWDRVDELDKTLDWLRRRLRRDKQAPMIMRLVAESLEALYDELLVVAVAGVNQDA